MRSSLKFALAKLVKINKAVEVGVQRGKNACDMLESGVREVYLVDPYTPYLNGAFPDKFGNSVYVEDILPVTQEEQNACKKEMLHRVSFYGDRVKIFNTTSVQAATLFPDEYFDYAYIDGDHKYAPVMADLIAWYPKVRKGGVLSGHDFTKPHLGVARAVKEFAKERGLKAYILKQDGNWRKNVAISDWWINV